MYLLEFLEQEGYTNVKRSEIKRRPLSDTVLASIEPETREYRELDGNGLYLRVKIPDDIGSNGGNYGPVKGLRTA